MSVGFHSGNMCHPLDASQHSTQYTHTHAMSHSKTPKQWSSPPLKSLQLSQVMQVMHGALCNPCPQPYLPSPPWCQSQMRATRGEGYTQIVTGQHAAQTQLMWHHSEVQCRITRRELKAS